MRDARKTIVAALTALAAAAALAAQTATASPAAGAAKPAIELRLAEIQPPDHPTAKADFEFARLVRERSGGRIRISVYTDSVLGQEVSVLEQLQFGAIDIARVSLSAIAALVPRLNALQMPYLYRDADQMWRVLGGPIGAELLASVTEADFVGLGWFEAGARSFYSSKAPFRRPADLVGKSLRVQENPTMVALASAFGAKPWARPFGEVYSALETGEIDAAENNIPTYYSSRQYLVAPWYTLTEHARIPEIIVGSGVAFAALPPADRALIAKAAADTVPFQRGAWADYEREATAKLKEAGVKFVTPLDPAAFRRLADRVGREQSPEILALIERIKAVK
jgi:tripartite ATP-independent transporter DctP family solute receptor